MGEAASFLPLVLIVLAFYFLLIRPQSKRAKAQRQMQAELAPGSSVMLTSGIFGELTRTDDPERVDVRVADGVVLTVARAAIANVVPERAPLEATDPVDPAVEARADGREPGEDVPGRREL
ncbi:preprotein translocase subunit YajC [Nocardioides lentus]|uniref:Preprotein translocase subunit YajC n=1 Tax=Nocardioides lentus TaxID=338077 RepID=A0ABN2PTC6_9ACTN